MSAVAGALATSAATGSTSAVSSLASATTSTERSGVIVLSVAAFGVVVVLTGGSALALATRVVLLFAVRVRAGFALLSGTGFAVRVTFSGLAGFAGFTGFSRLTMFARFTVLVFGARLTRFTGFALGSRTRFAVLITLSGLAGFARLARLTMFAGWALLARFSVFSVFAESAFLSTFTGFSCSTLARPTRLLLSVLGLLVRLRPVLVFALCARTARSTSSASVSAVVATRLSGLFAVQILTLAVFLHFAFSNGRLVSDVGCVHRLLAEHDLKHRDDAREAKVVQAFFEGLVLVLNRNVANFVGLVKPLNSVLDEFSELDRTFYGIGDSLDDDLVVARLSSQQLVRALQVTADADSALNSDFVEGKCFLHLLDASILVRHVVMECFF